jgi:hypothetical protein
MLRNCVYCLFLLLLSNLVVIRGLNVTSTSVPTYSPISSPTLNPSQSVHPTQAPTILVYYKNVSSEQELDNSIKDGALIHIRADIYLTTTVSISGDKTVEIHGHGNKVDGQNRVKCFSIESVYKVDVIFNQLIITDCYGEGGGINMVYSTVVLNYCTISHCVSPLGGGAVYNSGDLTLNHCLFLNNSALGPQAGGAIMSDSAFLTISDSIFENNTAMKAVPVVTDDYVASDDDAWYYYFSGSSSSISSSKASTISHNLLPYDDEYVEYDADSTIRVMSEVRSSTKKSKYKRQLAASNYVSKKTTIFLNLQI